MPSPSEKEKMLAGETYRPFTAELEGERAAAKDLCFRYNQTPPGDAAARAGILKDLFGSVAVGDDSNDPATNIHIESPFHCDYGYNIRVGLGFYANHGCTFLDCNAITFGDNCQLGPGVVVSTATHPLDAGRRAAGDEMALPISIGDNAWIGANACILQGVTLGNNVVVGAGAVVTKDMPDNVVCAGVPAKIIREIRQET